VSHTDIAAALERRVREVYHGSSEVVELLLTALASGTHVLLEGPPGTAKTLLAWSLAHSVGLSFRRAQMTPDLMPSDLLGTNVWLPNEGRFELRPGPLFTGVLLADELNRAPPKTQAALLEAMQERRITLDGQTRELDPAFWVVATQNPLEQEGTYPLPESQLDRFGLKIAVGYPDEQAERALLRQFRDHGDAMHTARRALAPVLDRDAFVAWRRSIDAVRVDDTIVDYIQALVAATRVQPDLAWGAGPRAALTLLGCGRALAALRRRDYVIPDDVQDLALPALSHRVRLEPEAQVAGVTVASTLQRVLSSVTVPAVHGSS
jgi:MoxR-like ATPase